jgi:hypothetical protein
MRMINSLLSVSQWQHASDSIVFVGSIAVSPSWALNTTMMNRKSLETTWTKKRQPVQVTTYRNHSRHG